MTRQKALSLLSDTDRDILGIIVEHRVVTTTQMQTLLGIPGRTVRYRLARLWKLALIGSDRPYTPYGSSPAHWWPSRTAVAYVNGAAIPRQGEREDPNEQFLEHAAAITGFYTGLYRLAPTLGVEVLSFKRETEGREEFRYSERTAAVVPDVSLVLRAGAAEYHALVEIDLGTMSMPRLAKKLGLYAAWARLNAWEGLHPYLPVLLILTTTPRRVEAALSRFEDKCRWEARRSERYREADRLQSFTIGVCDAARRPEHALADAIWQGRDGADKLKMFDLLHEAWARHDAAVRTKQRREEDEEAYRRQLLGDPERLRSWIQKREENSKYGIDAYREPRRALNEQQRLALQILLEETSSMTEVERDAYRFFQRRTVIDVRTGEPRELYSDAPAVTDDERRAIALLHRLYLARQRERLAALHARYPYLPCIVRAIADIQAGRLVDWLRPSRRDSTIKEELSRAKRDVGRNLDYLAWRDAEIEHRRARLGKLERLTFHPERVARELDEAKVRVCADCERIEILDEHQPSWQREPRCTSCGREATLLNLTDALIHELIEPDAQGFWSTCHVRVPDWMHRVSVPAPDVDPQEA